MNQKILIFIALLAAQPIVANKKNCESCSSIRNAYLHIKNATSSQKSKDKALYRSVVTGDYCGSKFWLEHGGDLKRSFGKLYKETSEGTYLHIPVLAPMFERSKLLPIYPSSKILDLLKDYGIDGFKDGPK